jgi:hypothetical protein
MNKQALIITQSKKCVGDRNNKNTETKLGVVHIKRKIAYFVPKILSPASPRPGKI